MSVPLYFSNRSFPRTSKVLAVVVHTGTSAMTLSVRKATAGKLHKFALGKLLQAVAVDRRSAFLPEMFGISFIRGFATVRCETTDRQRVKPEGRPRDHVYFTVKARPQ